MQIMINIPEEVYQKIKETSRFISGRRSGKRIDYILFNAIKNGTPLPKGHGRLIDADALWKKWVFDAIGKQEIDAAPPIIEADKAESEPQEISDRNLKMWEEIYAEENRSESEE